MLVTFSVGFSLRNISTEEQYRSHVSKYTVFGTEVEISAVMPRFIAAVVTAWS